MTFEESLARLEAIVRELESQNLPLERALTLFQEGVERLRDASSELGRADASVKRLVEGPEGGFELADVDE